MNWILGILGVPIGMLLFQLGSILAKKLKPKSATIEGLLLATPFGLFCMAVLLIDIFLETVWSDMIVGLFAVSLTATIFVIILRKT
jgi:hypothetical protein